MDSTLTSLANRDGLPEPFRILLGTYPRATWEQHPNFGALVQFWMARHMMFRRVTMRLRDDLRAVLWEGSDPGAYKGQLGVLGQRFLQELHGHHQIEDHHYFPRLQGLEPRVSRGFDLLDADHHEIDAMLARFAEAANAALHAPEGAAQRDALGHLEGVLESTERTLLRHLEDEEDLIVPVILQSGFEG